MKYLREFIIGSSAFAIMPWMYLQTSLRKKTNTVNYDYYSWSLWMPMRLGLWNVFSLMIAEYFGLSMRMRFISIALIHTIVTIFVVKYLDKYTYNDEQWNEYYRNLLMLYLIHWNIVIYALEIYI